MTEFELIANYFATQTEKRDDVILSIGDDAAITMLPPNHQLVTTTDTLIAGVHFPLTTSTDDIGYKALAVNLSDLAAMGASPAWVMLALTLPEANESWLQAFCTGFFTLANRERVQLIGGDTTKGPLSITVQAMGFVPQGQALLRSNAKVDDLIYVTGTLGDAGLALRALQQKIEVDKKYSPGLLEKLNRPEPRIVVGKALLGIAHAAIDISDGLAADLGHILKASNVGAEINVNQLPLSEALTHTLSLDEAIQLALTAGDDYELCFTIPAAKKSALEAKLATIACRYTCIGKITAQKNLNLVDDDGKKYHGKILGYRHF